MDKIAVAVTCYNNDDEVVSFAENLAKQSWSNKIDFLVTVNRCNNLKQLKQKLLDKYSNTYIYEPHKNLGYLNGCLYGIRNSTTTYSWVMICNTDIELINNNFFEVGLKNIDEEIWCIGPNIILKKEGEKQNPFMIFPPSKMKTLIWKIIYSNYYLFSLYFGLYRIKKKICPNLNSSNSSMQVYAVHGSCFLVKNNCLKLLKQDAEGIFMYGEELLVAEIVRSNKANCYYNSRLSVIHNENQVTGLIPNRKKQHWYKESMEYLCEKYFDL